MPKKDGKSFKEKYNIKWIISISIITFILAIIFSVIAENMVNKLNIFLAFFTLILIILIGIGFDIIGIAVTRAEEKPFHSMAAKKIDEAKVAINLVRNAGPVSNFCNDVVGDICGIISGAVGASLIIKLTIDYGFKDSALLNILISAVTASLTVGGKAMGKDFAMVHYESIVIKLARFIDLVERTFNVNFFKDSKSKKNKDREKVKKNKGESDE